MRLMYLGFYHWGELVPTDALWDGKEDFSYVEKKRTALVTTATQGHLPA